MKQSLIQSAKGRARGFGTGSVRFVATRSELNAFLEQELTLAIDSYKKELRDKVNVMKIIPVEIPHRSPYISGVNEAVKKVLSIIDEE